MTDTDHPSYPERRPSDTRIPERFLFKLKANAELRDRVSAEIADLEGQVDTVVRRTEVDDAPVLLPILRWTQNPDDLARMGRALVSLAPVVAKLATLRAQLELCELVEHHPHFLMSAFGDFSDEFEGLERLRDDAHVPVALSDDPAPRPPRLAKDL